MIVIKKKIFRTALLTVIALTAVNLLLIPTAYGGLPCTIETFKADGVTPSTIFDIGETCVIVVEFSWPPYDVIIVDPNGVETQFTSPGSTFTTSIVLNEIGIWEIQVWKQGDTSLCQYVDKQISVITVITTSEAVTVIPLTACLSVLGYKLLMKRRRERD